MKSNKQSAQHRVTDIFGRVAEFYDEVEPRIFSQLGCHLVDLAELIETQKVLDVATGKGAILFPAAKKVDFVIGIDMTPRMIDLLEDKIKKLGLLNINVRVMDAELLEFPNESFDTVFCGFAIYFFPNPDRALSEFKRTLKPNGIVALSGWHEQEDERWQWLRQLMKEAMGQSQQPEPFANPDSFREALKTAGFTDIEVTEKKVDLCYADFDQWLRWSLSNGFRAVLEKIGSTGIEHLKQTVLPQLEQAREADGLLHRRLTALFARGRKRF